MLAYAPIHVARRITVEAAGLFALNDANLIQKATPSGGWNVLDPRARLELATTRFAWLIPPAARLYHLSSIGLSGNRCIRNMEK